METISSSLRLVPIRIDAPLFRRVPTLRFSNAPPDLISPLDSSQPRRQGVVRVVAPLEPRLRLRLRLARGVAVRVPPLRRRPQRRLERARVQRRRPRDPERRAMRTRAAVAGKSAASARGLRPAAATSGRRLVPVRVLVEALVEALEAAAEAPEAPAAERESLLRPSRRSAGADERLVRRSPVKGRVVERVVVLLVVLGAGTFRSFPTPSAAADAAAAAAAAAASGGRLGPSLRLGAATPSWRRRFRLARGACT